MSYLLLSLEYRQCPSTGGGAHTSEWVLTDLADSSQLATPQRLRAKMEKVIHTLKATSLALRGGGMEGRNLEADRRVRVAEDRARELAEQVSQVSCAGLYLVSYSMYDQTVLNLQLRLARERAQTRLQESEAGRLEAQTRLQESETEKEGMVSDFALLAYRQWLPN